MSESLLPGNATPLERAATKSLAQIERVPIPLRELWNPNTCPLDLLPYLAWAFSVDRWNPDWDEPTKRGVVKNSFYVHKHKGTISALRRVVEPLGYLIEITEWWQLTPEGQAGTFQAAIGVLDAGITEEMYTELERVLDDAKPVSRHLIGLDIRGETRGKFYIGAGTYTGETVSVLPYQPGDLESIGAIFMGGADHTIDTVSVYPQ